MRLRIPRNLRPPRLSPHRPQVIPHIQRSRTLGANRLRPLRRNLFPTPRTLQLFYFWHPRSVAAAAFIAIHRDAAALSLSLACFLSLLCLVAATFWWPSS